MHMEVRALFGRFVWRVVNIDDVTIHPSRFKDQSHTEAGLNNRGVVLLRTLLLLGLSSNLYGLVVIVIRI